jgi:hypothetical protein
MGYRLAKQVADASPHLKGLSLRPLLLLHIVALYALDTPGTDGPYTLPAGFYGFGNDWLITHTGRERTPSNRAKLATELRTLKDMDLVVRCPDPRPFVHTTGLMVRIDNL